MAEKNRPCTVYIEDFEENRESYGGFCTTCREFTNMSEVEPDAEKYRCVCCNENPVYGAEQALLLGLITISDEDYEE